MPEENSRFARPQHYLDAMVNDTLMRFYRAAAAANLPIPLGIIEIDWQYAPHEPPTLPKNKMAIYAFFLDDGSCLKCGKVGPRSNARYTFQHYLPNSANSTLAASLLKHGKILPHGADDEKSVGPWMRTSLDRVNFLLPADLKFGPAVLSYLEAFLHVCWNPIFEGSQKQSPTY